MLKRLLLAAFLLCATPALARQQSIESALEAFPKGARVGLLVVDETGREIAAKDPDQRFIPASNTKIVTTAAAYALLPEIDRPDVAGGTQVWLDRRKGKGPPDVRLTGRGDARMSSAPDCKVNCLAALADAVAAKTRQVRDVIGDDSAWPDQRWGLGMSWNNIGTDSGTAISALNLDNNVLALTVTPGAVGTPPVVTVAPYFTLKNEAVTVEASGAAPVLFIERAVNGMDLRLYGEIPADAKAWREWLGIDDPAHFAAWSLRRMLVDRGVKVAGRVRAEHRPVWLADRPRPGWSVDRIVAATSAPLASLTPPPLAEDVRIINKISQNLHAEALLRRIGAVKGTGSREWGRSAIGDLLEQAGIPRDGYDLSDGSGMSTYNRLSPRATVALLRWIAAQPWGEKWYATLPVAGQEGSLRGRFAGTVLESNLAAKTGRVNATLALSGRFRAKSGQMLTFSLFANDLPEGTGALAAIDATLVALAEQN